MSKPSKTIKNISEEDLSYFSGLKENGKTDADVFAMLVEMHRKASGLLQENQKATEENQYLQDARRQQENQIQELFTEIENLKAREPEKVEVEKPVPVPLIGFQFICDPPEDLAMKMRKIRRFCAKDKRFEFTEENYPDKLTQHAVSAFIKEEYSHIT